MNRPKLCQLLDIKLPIILAPMFLVTNKLMVTTALDNGISAAIPAMNYRTIRELERTIIEIKEHSNKAFGINIIANQSNSNLKEQIAAVVNTKPAFVISSLGNPQQLIEKLKPYGIKVFCDVTDEKYALKVETLGADALIAVNSQAGGHAGKLSLEELIDRIKQQCNIPVIAAGGISNATKLNYALKIGYSGASIGTIFIASTEAPVSDAYKQALIEYSGTDIVLTDKLSGSPTTVINTPYVQKTGTKRNFPEKVIKTFPAIKKIMKSYIMKRGMTKLGKAAFSNTYKNVWCAGPSITDIHQIRPLEEIINDFKINT